MKDCLKKFMPIFLFLLLLTCAGSPPKKSDEGIDPGYCMGCHIERTPGLFQAWVEPTHDQKGVNCVTCHTDPEAAYGPKTVVFPDKCGECHAKQLEEFRKSRHSLGWEQMRTQGEYLSIPQEIRSPFCERCHARWINRCRKLRNSSKIQSGARFSVVPRSGNLITICDSRFRLWNKIAARENFRG
jgi:hypothetical protein